MRHLRKRHSWPPICKDTAMFANESIDADPFAYFVSSSEERLFDAGISNKARSHSLPPFHRRHRVPLSISTNRKSPTARLKKWIEKMETLYFHRTTPDKPTPIIELVEARQPASVPQLQPIDVPRSPPVRGRGQARSTSNQRVGANGRTPPRRPRVWREPSCDIWPVAEESEEVGLGITT